MRVFSVGLRSLVYPWAEAGPLKEPESRWTGIPRYPEHRQLLRKIQPWLQISEGDELDLGEMTGLNFGGER
jgi:hypothetical protein